MRPVQTLKLDASEQRQGRGEDVAIARGNDVPQMSGGAAAGPSQARVGRGPRRASANGEAIATAATLSNATAVVHSHRRSLPASRGLLDGRTAIMSPLSHDEAAATIETEPYRRPGRLPLPSREAVAQRVPSGAFN